MVLDANSGAVVGMASFPDYTPQGFVDGFATEDYAALLDSQAFNNLAIQGQYPPGSVYKMITAAAGLQEGTIDRNTPIRCPAGGIIHIEGPSVGLVDLLRYSAASLTPLDAYPLVTTSYAGRMAAGIEGVLGIGLLGALGHMLASRVNAD